jgi:DNA-directed RNA polymerase subunit RPC12/RpoP
MEETKCYRCDKVKSSYTEIDGKYFCAKCFGKVKVNLEKLSKFPKFKCPKCNSNMIPGEAKVHGSLSSFLIAGISIQHLWFEPYDGSFEKSIALESLQSTDAFFCETCKFVFLDAKKSRLGK